MTATEGSRMSNAKAEEQVRLIAKSVRPAFTRYVQKDDDGNEVIVGELPRALALVEAGGDPVEVCEQIIDERIASSARSIRERDGDPYPPCETYLPASERRTRALAAIGEKPDEAEKGAEAAALRAEAEKAAAEKDAEIARLREELAAAKKAPEPKTEPEKVKT